MLSKESVKTCKTNQSCELGEQCEMSILCVNDPKARHKAGGTVGMAKETCLFESKGYDEGKIGKSIEPAFIAPSKPGMAWKSAATLRHRPFATFNTNLLHLSSNKASSDTKAS